jgi:acyl-CoA dehydrogenase
MVFAMHQIQVACLVHHALEQPWLAAYLRRLAESQRLIASVTSEVGVGGSTRTSVCAVERKGSRVRLVKDATTISYGQDADDLLVTARAHADAAPGDQAMVLLESGDFQLKNRGHWDTLGMRGTCSAGALVDSEAAAEQVLDVPFAEISALTMVPVSHLVWTALWSGIAASAVSRAARFVREEARKKPGTTPPAALRLAEVHTELQAMRSGIAAMASEYETLRTSAEGRAELTGMGFAIRINNLKIHASQAVTRVVHQALQICGIHGYKNDSPFSVARQLRDAHSASLMVANDRIYASNASLLLVHKEA